MTITKETLAQENLDPLKFLKEIKDALGVISAHYTPTPTPNTVLPPGWVSVSEYGAVGDGVTDDIAAIQETVDYVIYRNQSSGGISLGVVYFPPGVYLISDTIHLGYGENYHSVHIQGSGPRYRAESYFAGTAITPNFSDRPAINVQGARYTRIRGLTLKGLNFDYIEANGQGAYATPSVDDLVEANWVDPALHANADSRYAPYAGISIDAYSGTAPATDYPDVTFPSWSGISTQYGKNHSSGVLIEDVEIAGFVVGVVNAPCDADQNGDFTKIISCSFEMCVFGVSIGNTQSRGVRISSCVFSLVHKCITTGEHGVANGKPDILVDSCELSFCTYWCDVQNMTTGNGLHFLNCYGETVYAFGWISGNGARLNTARFTACEVVFDRTYRGYPAVVLTANGPVSFSNCTFTSTNADMVNMHFSGGPSSITFENCAAFIGETVSLYSEKHYINATAGITFGSAAANAKYFDVRSSIHWNLNTGASNGANFHSPISSRTSRQTCVPVYAGRIRAVNTGNDPGFAFAGNAGAFNGPAYGKSAMTGITSQTGRTLVIDFTGSAAGEWQLIQQGGEVGDYIVDDTTNTVFVVTSRTGLTLTMKAMNNFTAAGNIRDTIIGSSGTMWAVNCRRYTLGKPTFATFTAASPIMTAFECADGDNSYIESTSNGIEEADFLFIGDGSVFNPTDITDAEVVRVDDLVPDLELAQNINYTQSRVRQELYIRAAPANGT